VLALGANAPIQPPHGGMVEQQRLNYDLENIHERIEALNVGKFMRHN
jgi:hypothetical protein